MDGASTHVFENQSPKEEIANSVTHGAGVLLSLAGTAVLVTVGALEGSALKVASFAVFGFSLVVLYLCSTLYHASTSPIAKRVFHVFDHNAIFLLIAGTYTPVTLVALKGGPGWILFGITWLLAVCGVVATSLFFEKARYLNVIIYVAMGWLIAFAWQRLLDSLSGAALFWLILGGLLYTGGVYFYRRKRRYYHMIWHLFVLGGSTCHFFMMLLLK